MTRAEAGGLQPLHWCQSIGCFQRGGRGAGLRRRVRRQVAGQVRVGRRLRLLHRRGAQGGLPRIMQRLLTDILSDDKVLCSECETCQ